MARVTSRDGWRILRYAGIMRYPDGGGLTAQERARREQVRLAAAELIEAGGRGRGGGRAVRGGRGAGERGGGGPGGGGRGRRGPEGGGGGPGEPCPARGP